MAGLGSRHHLVTTLGQPTDGVVNVEDLFPFSAVLLEKCCCLSKDPTLKVARSFVFGDHTIPPTCERVIINCFVCVCATTTSTVTTTHTFTDNELMDGKGVKWDPVPDPGYDSIGQLPGLEDVVLPSVNEDMTRQSTGTNDVAFQIFAKTLCGKSVSLRVDPTTTVMELKSKIALIENLKGGEIRILCGGKDLHDDQETLSEHGIRDMTKITILARLRGGADLQKKFKSHLSGIVFHMVFGRASKREL